YKNHLLKGVKKGALTEAQADEKFQAWMDANELKKKEIISKLEADTRSQKKARLAEEEKIKEARAAELAKKRMAEEPAEEGVEEVEKVEKVEEVEKEVDEPAAEEAKEKPNDET
ncbi:MAG: 30S ribosomal protein S16, partial [Bacteroidales bacterium]|nr:30S ribosomal protein S16 [Bacteroidales bacterium]